MMTKLLYFDDSYRKEFDAFATSIEGMTVILDQTCFYPTSGGQPHDIGILTCNGETYRVLSVNKSSNGVVHEVDHAGIPVGATVHGVIDWERRYTLMRYHTAEHLFSSVLEKHTQCHITGNELSLDKARADYSVERLDRSQVEAYVAEANTLIAQNLPVKSFIITRDQLPQYPKVFKLAKAFPEHIHEIRLVAIGEIDLQADGGTHVKSTKEIGTLRLGGIENKGKGRKRIYITLNTA